jgi:hypothetical protein
MGRRDSHAQRRRADPKSKRSREHRRFSVDPRATADPDFTSNAAAVHSRTIRGLPLLLRPYGASAIVIPNCPPSRRGRVPAPIFQPSRYRLFETRIASPASDAVPSGPVQCRSVPSAPGPATSGTVSSNVRSFALRYSG